MMLTVRPATLAHAEWIGARLRPEDEREVLTSTGSPGSVVVPLSYQYAKECYVAFAEDRHRLHSRPADNPCLIFGACDDPANADVGIVWMLGTDEIKRCPVSILREAKHWIDYFAQKYPRGLYNFVDARNDLHVRWLTLLGFVMQGTIQRGGETFHYALRRNPEDSNV